VKPLHFSLAPRPRVILRRWRLLPTDGVVLLDVGDRVQADTVVARARGQGAMVTVNVASALDLRPVEVAAAMVRAVGEPVAAGEVLARTHGLWGWLGSVCRSPVGGTVVAVSQHTGQVLIERPSAPLEVRAYLPGIVAEVVPGRGVAVTGWGALVPGVFGVGAECAGELVLAVRRPDAALTGELVGDDHAGQILVAGALVTGEALARAAEAGARGVIAGGVRAADLAVWLGRELAVADTTDVAAPLTLVVLGGFGRVPLDRRVFALLAASEGRQACLSGVTRVRAGAVRPEIVIPLATPSAGGAADEGVTAVLVEGCRVLIVREPWFGSRGRVARLPRELQTLTNEARCLVAEVDLDEGGTVQVPRANLEVVGEPEPEATA
jgi:hypothetical protein